MEQNIKRLVNIACIKDRTKDFRILQCLGAFKDTTEWRYGLIFRLPDYLSRIKNNSNHEAVTIRRKPVSLLSLLEKQADKIPESLKLATRIGIGRKIAQSLLLVHASGWVHKK